jgi:hypothetical protein
MANPLTDLIRFLAAMGFADSTRNQLIPPPLVVSAKTTAYQILPTDRNGTIFTNRAAGGSVTFTLPAVASVVAGTYYEFLGVAAQTIVIATATVDTLLAINDVAADTITISTSMQIIGAHAKVVNDGTQWCFVGDTVGITYTLAT